MKESTKDAIDVFAPLVTFFVGIILGALLGGSALNSVQLDRIEEIRDEIDRQGLDGECVLKSSKRPFLERDCRVEAR